jgi:hypothetical protein
MPVTQKLSLLFLLPVLLLTNSLFAQVTDETVRLLSRLDSVRNSTSVSRHFAAIYFETTAGAMDYFSQQDQRGQQLVQRLELCFADFFFAAAEAHQENRPVAREWDAYYADSAASPLACLLYGVNAHINGDIWQALTLEFTAQELNELRGYYLRYIRELYLIYETVYARALSENKKIRTLHSLSLGLDKWYGRTMLVRWRKRQLRLAGLFFTNQSLFEKKRKLLDRKMERLNRLIKKHG